MTFRILITRYAFDSQPVLAPLRQLRQTEDAYLASPGYFAWYWTAPYSRLVNGANGGWASYGNWRKVLTKAQGFTAAHKDDQITYTAHALRHVAASLVIASGASRMEVQNQIGHRKIETTDNIYGHLFVEDRTALLTKLNSKATQLYVVEDVG